MGARTRSQVIRVDEGEHLPLLADFIRAVWTPGIVVETLQASRARAASSNPAHPGQAPPTFLFLIDGRAVGHLTTIPTLLAYDGQRCPAHWLKGFWVLPEHRNGPIGAMLVREATRQLDCLLATVVEEAPRRVFEAFGIRDRGCLSEHVKLLRPERVIRRLSVDALGIELTRPIRLGLAIAQWPVVSDLAGVLVRLALSVPGLVNRGARDHQTSVDGSAEGIDALWQHVAAGGSCGPARDASYFERRYGRLSERPTERYRVLKLVRQGTTIAWAVIRRASDGQGHPRLRGIRLATLVELVVPSSRPEDGLALIRQAELLAYADGADALLCSVSHASLRRLISSRGFVRVGGSLHLAVRDPKSGPVLPKDLDEWWITRADGGADESL